MKDSKFPFKPGMSASVEIQTNKERNVLAVPVNAVATRDYPDSLKKKNEGFDQIRQVVFVYNKDKNEVVMRDVKTDIQDNTNIRILDGLKEGDEVVIAPYGAVARTLKDKSKVKPVPKDQLFETTKEEKKD
jgi:HlyD family secretion protein